MNDILIKTVNLFKTFIFHNKKKLVHKKVSITDQESDNCEIEKFKAIALEAIQFVKKNNNLNYKMFNDYHEVIEWAKINCSDWLNTLSCREKEIIKYYSGNMYLGINKYLREGRENFLRSLNKNKLSENCNDYIKWLEEGDVSYTKIIMILDKAIAKFNLRENIIVFRRLDYNGFMELSPYLKYNYKSKICVDDIIRDKAYLSTSLIFDFDLGECNYDDHDNVLLIIRVPKGTLGACIQHFSVECEFLLSHGLYIVIDQIFYENSCNLIALCYVLGY